MKTLYRKYRPLRLEDVIGQEQVTMPLSNALKAGKVVHAYLFTGPRGTGKTSVARILAHQVNGFLYELEDDYVDIIEIDGASNRGIDNIRELREKAMIAPSQGRYKIYIIDEVHMLTKEAFNALLKTLEEPPEHVIFVMATTDAYKVPVTITSRSQIFNFRLVDGKVMCEHLRKIAEAEQITITDEALGIIAERGGGSFRDSLSLLDQISTLTDGEITADLIIKAMGLPETRKISELLQAYAEGNVVKITAVYREVLAGGVKAEVVAEELMQQIIAEPRPEMMPLLEKLPEVKAPFAEARLLVALLKVSDGHFPERATTGAAGNSFSGPTAPVSMSYTGTPEGEFDWQAFLNKVKGLNDAVYSQLVKAKYEYRGGVLKIYPARKVAQMILSKENNLRVLVEAAGDVKITIGDSDGGVKMEGEDELIAKMSGIMGGEVLDDGGSDPF